MERDTALIEECRALTAALAPFANLDALRASPGWPALRTRFERLLGQVRQAAPPLPPEAGAGTGADLGRLRVVHWNLEHGNAFERIALALETHPELAHADVYFLNEVDLGMARSGNRDVAGELGAVTRRHAAWAPLFLETTPGRHDDALTTHGQENLEALFGIAILSRWPITAVRALPLPSPERYQFDYERMIGRHVALIAEIDRPGAPFVAIAAHLEVHRTRQDRARQMMELLAGVARETRPILLAGDFNTHTFDRGLPWSVPDGARVLLLTPGHALRRRLLFPDRGSLREMLFDELRRAGFSWEPLNDHVPTLRLNFDRVDEVRHLARLARIPLERVLTWAEKRCQLRLDWIAQRGFQGGLGHTVRGLDGPGHASDHAPLVAEVW